MYAHLNAHAYAHTSTCMLTHMSQYEHMYVHMFIFGMFKNKDLFWPKNHLILGISCFSDQKSSLFLNISKMNMCTYMCTCV